MALDFTKWAVEHTATLEPQIDIPGEVVQRYWCRNTEPVTSGLGARVGEAFNHVRGYRKKQLFMKASNLMHKVGSPSQHIGPRADTPGSQEWWQFYGHTGYGTTKLRLLTIVQPSLNTAATSPGPLVEWTLRGNDDVVTGTPHRSRAGAFPQGVDPAQMTTIIAELDVAENEFYRGSLRVKDGIVLIAATVLEVGEDPVTRGGRGVANLDDAPRDDILDGRFEQTVRAGTDLWRRNAAPVFCWSRLRAEGDAPSVTGTTYTNILDATTSVSSSSVGFCYNLTDMATVRGDGVPCRLAVLASVTANAGECKLVAADGDIVEITGMDALVPTWYVKDALVTALSRKVDIHARNDTSGDVVIHAVALLQYCHERSFPETASNWDHVFVGIGRRPQGLWACQTDDSTEAKLSDAMGNQPMDEGGTASTITYQVVPDSDLDPYRDYAVQIDNGGYFEAGDAAFLDAGDECSGVVRVFIPSSPAGDVCILAKQDGATDAGYRLTCSSSTGNISLTAHDGTSGVSSTIASDFRGRWVDIAWAIDIANTELRLRCRSYKPGTTLIDDTDTDSIAALSSLSNTITFKLGSGGGTGARSQLYSWVCAHDAYALTDADRTIILAPDYVAQEGAILV